MIPSSITQKATSFFLYSKSSR